MSLHRCGAARLLPRAKGSPHSPRQRHIVACSPPSFSSSSSSSAAAAAAASAESSSPFSSSSASAPKVQLAGRRRFYRRVSIIPAPAPWAINSKDGIDAKGTSVNASTTVASPISAGVDGTDSASGVVVVSRKNQRQWQRGTGSSNEYYQRWLKPRHPDGREYHQPLNNEEDGNGAMSMSTWHAVCLDGKVLQTPARSKVLAVPSQALAAAIAAEWDQQSPLLKPAQMPLTTLACTILDQVCEQPQHYQQSVLGYVGTDTLRYWADPINDPILYNEQERLWTPVLGRLGKILGRDFPTQKADSNVIIFGKQRQSLAATSPLHQSDEDELAKQCRRWVEALDAWHLGVLYSLTVEAKSFGLAMAYVRRGGPQQAHPNEVRWHDQAGFSTPEDHYIAACRVEEEVQISQWGMVEGGHDYDRLNCAIQVRAASFLRRCLDHELAMMMMPERQQPT